MIVGVAIAELHIPHARSLKEKRSVVRRIKDQLRNRLSISVAEVAMQDLHQRTRLGVSFVSPDAKKIDALFETVSSMLDEDGDAVLIGWMTESLDFDSEVNLGVHGIEFGE